MGDKNVIALLTSINGNLKKIVEISQTNGTQSKEKVSEKMTQSLNTGTVLTGDAVKPKAEQGKIGDIVISADTIAALKSLPLILRAFSKIKEKDLDSFIKTLETIKKAVDSFSNIENIDKSIDSLNAISRFMLVLEKTNFSKVAVSIKVANALGFTSGLKRIIEGIAQAANKAGDISKEDIKNLKAAIKSTEVINSLVKSVGLVVMSVGGLALLIKTVGLKEVMIAAGVSMGILVALSGLAIGIAVVTKNIQGATKSLNGISGFILKMQAIVLTTLAVGLIASKAWPAILKGFAATAGVILGYTLISALVSGLSEQINTDSESFNVIVKMAAWGMAITLGTLLMGVLAAKAWPEILIGFAAVSGVILGYTAIAALVSVVAKLSITFSKDIAAITFMSGAAIALTLATTLLGYVAELSWPQILYGFTATSAIIIGYTNIAALASKSAKGMYDAYKDFITIGAVIAGAELLLLGAIGLGKLLEKSSPVALAAAIVGIGGIIFAIDGVAKIAKKHTTSLEKAHINFAIAAGAIASAEVIILAAVGISKLINNWKDVYTAVGVLAATGAVVGALIGLLKRIEASSQTLAVGAKSLLLAASVALAAEGIILGAVLIGKLVEKDPLVMLEAAGVLVATGGVIYGLVSLIKVIEKHSKDLAKGATSLILAASVALAAEGLVLGAVLLAKAKKKADVTDGELIITITTAAGIITAFGSLAALAGTLEPTIKKGLPAMAYVEALALGATAIVFGIVKLLEVKNNANIDWADVFITIGAMGTVVAAFGALAAIAGIKPVVALMLAGSVGLGAAALLALGATKLMFNIVELIDEKNKANITWEDVYSTIDAMSTTVSTFGGLAVVASLATPFILSGIPAMAILGVLASANIKVLRSLVNVTAAVNELGPDGWTQITTAVTKMSNIISNDDEHNPGFAQLSKKATANLITISLGAVALKKVAVTANVAAEALIQMCTAAAALKGKESTDITNVISTFDAVTDSMYDMVGIKFMAKATVIGAAKSSIDKITLIAADISKAMSNMAMIAGPNGLIRSATVAKDGTLVYGEWVDCSASASTLANSMGSFVTILYDSFKTTTKNSFNLIEQGMKMMANIMSPVSTFAQTLAGFEGQDGKIRVIKYDDDGNQIETPYVDVRSVAQSIANSISTFCGVLFSAENQAIWERMTLGGVNIKSGKEGDAHMYSPSTTEAAMGIFATIIDPIGNFTSTLAKFSEGDGTTLIIPIYDSQGTLKETRSVNVVNAATTIGNAVSTFIKTLAGQSSEWMDIYKSYESGGLESKNVGFLGLSKETVDTRHNIFADAMGVFASVVTPVISFANMIAMFESGSDNILITIDSSTGKKKKVDVEKVALLISGAITTMITKLGSTFSTQIDSLKTISTNQQAIVEIMNGMSNAIAGIADVDATNANNVIEAYSTLLTKVLSLSTTGEITSLKDSNEALSELKTNISALGSKNITDSLNNTVDLFNKMNTSLNNIKESADIIDNLLSHISTAVTGNGPDVPANIKKVGGIEGLNNKMSDSFLTVKSSLHKFDTALDSGNEKRIKNIKSIAAAVKELNDESANARDNLTAIKEVLNAIATLSAKSSSGELGQVVNSLNSISIGRGGNYGGGSGTSKDTIVSAVQEALDGLALTGQMPTISVDRMGKIIARDSIIELGIDIDKVD